MNCKYFSCVLFLGIALFQSGCSLKKVEYTPPKNLPTYFDINHTSVATIKDVLYAQAFRLIHEEQLNNKNVLLVYTHKSLQRFAKRGQSVFLADALRILVDTNATSARVTNPEYFVKAFLDDQYELADGSKLRENLLLALKGAVPSHDAIAFEKLQNYAFMIGMPTYKEYITLYESDDLQKIETLLFTSDNNKSIAYVYKLNPSQTIVGVRLPPIEEEVAQSFGREYTFFSPWTVVISEKKEGFKTYYVVKTLNPKYLLALYYPKLNLERFFPIMGLPSTIESELRKLFIEVKE